MSQTQYQKVREFMQAFGQECPERPVIPSSKIRELRLQLHEEECVNEYCLAIDANDLVKVFDSVLDGLVVVLGTAIAFGITEEMVAKGFAEVHRSNMSKFWTTAELEAHYKANGKGGLDFTMTGCSPGRFICKDATGKVIKSPSYSPANLGPILEGTK